jgi:S1/P1 Nuclease
MKRSLSLFISVAMLLFSSEPTLAWGEKGHQAVGSIAAMRIKPATAAKLKSILQPGESLSSISTWADDVKYRIGEHDPDADTNAFLQDELHNKNNNEWHYVDLALGCENYDACPEFQRNYDIVHMINVCVSTLRGRPDPDHPLSRRNALRLLVHLVGDLHQPLHVGTGYIDSFNPNQIRLVTDRINIIEQNLPSDQGANLLIVDKDRANLHSFWDFELVSELMNVTRRSTSDSLAQLLKLSVPPRPDWSVRGPVDSWASQWASDSLQVSRSQTYRDVQILRQRSIPVLRRGEPLVRDGQQVMQTVYDISKPADYMTVNRNVVRQQLTKAGFRLARLLDVIFS